MESKYSHTLKTTCDKCDKDVRRFKFLKKMNGGRFCKKCASKKRLEHREFLKREVCHIKKRKDMEKEWEKKRKEKEKWIKLMPKIEKPDIKSVRINKVKISSLGLFITKIERFVLYKKLIGKGLDGRTAKERVTKLCNQMELITDKLRNEVKTKEELDKRFREEFGKMCMELESGELR